MKFYIVCLDGKPVFHTRTMDRVLRFYHEQEKQLGFNFKLYTLFGVKSRGRCEQII